MEVIVINWNDICLPYIPLLSQEIERHIVGEGEAMDT